MLAHAGLTLSPTTLMQWVAGSSELLGPLAEAIARYVLSAANINADDTPVKVLAPGTGKTKKGHLWTYVRDGRPWGSTDPPAVWYRYSPTWEGKYPQEHLASYVGKLQGDGYAGFEPLFLAPSPEASARVIGISCWGHARRKWFDIYEAQASPIALEALTRIGKLYDIEERIRYQSAEQRRQVRQDEAVPLLKELHAWMIGIAAQADKGSILLGAINYSVNRWTALMRYTDDGHLEIDNLAAERSLRGVGVGRKNYLFFGADSGGERAAIIYTIVESCKLNRIDPQRYLKFVLERIADHPINRIEELLPWNVIDQLGQPEEVTQALAA
jgi:transposase